MLDLVVQEVTQPVTAVMALNGALMVLVVGVALELIQELVELVASTEAVAAPQSIV